MCIADMAAGRRTITRRTNQSLANLESIHLPADPRRLRLVVSANNAASFLTLSDRSGDIQGWAYLPSFGGTVPVVLRVEEYGILIMSDVYIFNASGTDRTVTATEILADYTLDQVIQREV